MASSHLSSAEDPVTFACWDIGRNITGFHRDRLVNATAVLLDRNVATHSDKVALISRDHRGHRRLVSFSELLENSSRFANVLDLLGLSPGDRVASLLESMPEAYYAALGTIRVGAVFQPLFSGFGCEAIADRVQDAGSTIVVVGAAQLPKLRQALAASEQPVQVLVVGEEDDLQPGEQLLAPLLAAASAERPATLVEPEAPMLLHYSSGTTGKPKGVVLAHNALVGQAATAAMVLDLTADDTYWCTADIGWVTGTAYGVFGPWALGATQVSYAGGFSADAWYRIIAEENVSVWYTSPTALRALMRDDTAGVQAFDLSSLRRVYCIGEALNASVVEWGRKVFGLCIRDTWFQTETGCIQIANYPSLEVRPGSMGRPLPGVTAAVLDPTSGVQLSPGQDGLLALRPPWPSMFTGYWGLPDLYAEKFQNGWYLTGDRASMDSDGYFWFVSRDDDVINTSGHLVGPFEVESALLMHEQVAEAAAFGVPDERVGTAVVAKVVLKRDAQETRNLGRDLKTLVRRQVGGHAVPRVIVVVDMLPKTRSGKLMRRVARAEYLGLPAGDISTLERE